MDVENESVLAPKQLSRVAALKAAREVLGLRASGAFSSASGPVDVIDLYNIACWIIDGEDPWRMAILARDEVSDGRQEA